MDGTTIRNQWTLSVLSPKDSSMGAWYKGGGKKKAVGKAIY
jgi:hypothetical protein